jgi:hypothetical protein
MLVELNGEVLQGDGALSAHGRLHVGFYGVEVAHIDDAGRV